MTLSLLIFINHQTNEDTTHDGDDDSRGGGGTTRGNWNGNNSNWKGKSNIGKTKSTNNRATPYTGQTRAKRKCGICGQEGNFFERLMYQHVAKFLFFFSRSHKKQVSK